MRLRSVIHEPVFFFEPSFIETYLHCLQLKPVNVLKLWKKTMHTFT